MLLKLFALRSSDHSGYFTKECSYILDEDVYSETLGRGQFGGQVTGMSAVTTIHTHQGIELEVECNKGSIVKNDGDM